jgi:hypothetical protein
MIRTLYEGFKCRGPRRKADSFDAITGGRQDCTLSATLFILLLDNTMNKVIKARKRGLQWRRTERLQDLDFPDDICGLLAQRWGDTKAKLEKLETEAAMVGLKTNEFKTK